MDDTQSYLNSILQKRIGSVVNHSAFTKNGSTVARMPQQVENVESMPTVFRKKYETVYHNSQPPAELTGRTSFLSRQSAVEEKQQPVGSHRVEYMAISKRIEKKKDNEFTSPTVDVTKYRVSGTVVREKSPEMKEEVIKMTKMQKIQERHFTEEAEDLKISPDRPKRRRIFGLK